MELRTSLRNRIKTLCPIKSDKGFLLTAALTLLSLLILVGTTAYLPIFQSSQLKAQLLSVRNSVGSVLSWKDPVMLT